MIALMFQAMGKQGQDNKIPFNHLVKECVLASDWTKATEGIKRMLHQARGGKGVRFDYNTFNAVSEVCYPTSFFNREGNTYAIFEGSGLKGRLFVESRFRVLRQGVSGGTHTLFLEFSYASDWQLCFVAAYCLQALDETFSSPLEVRVL